MRAARPLAALAAGILTLAGCALARDVSPELPRATKPVKYRVAGADPELRRSLERAAGHLQEARYQAAVDTLNRALWDLERIESRWLRLEELAEAHRAFAAAYAALGKPAWADEHRVLALALLDRMRRAPGGQGPERSLGRGRDAYARARFRDALVSFGQALVDLEDVEPTALRIRRLEAARCSLALTYLALEDQARAREELERLAALDPALRECGREAPPALRRLIGEIQRGPGAR